jgi:hypothetical protein
VSVVKTCKTCGQTLPYSEFYKNQCMKDGHLSWCKKCTVLRYRDGVRRRAAEFRAYIQAIKMERGCADCGYREHPAALDFDHLPGSVKKGRLASMACGSALKTIHAEIDKCEVVCANCHRVRTATRRKAAGEELDPLEGS